MTGDHATMAQSPTDEPPPPARRVRHRPRNDDAFFESERRRRLYDERHAADDPLAAVDTFPAVGFFTGDPDYEPRRTGEPCTALERIIGRSLLKRPYAPTALEAETIVGNRDANDSRSRDIGRMIVSLARMEDVIEAEVDRAFSLQDVAWWITNAGITDYPKLYWLNSFSSEWMERHEDVDKAGIVPARRAIPRGVTCTSPHWRTYVVEETRRRVFDENVDRKRRLEPVDSFPNEMGFFGPPERLDARRQGEPCRAIAAIIARNCGGWISRPTALEAERVMRQRDARNGNVAVGGVIVGEGEIPDFISADRSHAFSLQDIAWWVCHVRPRRYRLIYWLNMFSHASLKGDRSRRASA